MLRQKLLIAIQKKQGRIHGYPSRERVGRSSAGEGYWVIWAGAIKLKNAEKVKRGPINRPTNQLHNKNFKS